MSYHIKPDGEAGKCRAEGQWSCPYGGFNESNSPHFTTLEEAQEFSEKLFKVEDKARKLKTQLSSLGEYPQLAEVIEFGRELDEVIQSGLSFNPKEETDASFHENKRAEYTRVVSMVLRGVTEDYAGADVLIKGKKAQEVKDAMMLLPHGVSGLMKGVPINVISKLGKKGDGTYSGMYRLGYFSKGRKPRTSEMRYLSYAIKSPYGQDDREWKVGEYRSGEDLTDPRLLGTTVYKKIDDDTVEEYWYGSKNSMRMRGVTKKRVNGSPTVLDCHGVDVTVENNEKKGLYLLQVAEKQFMARIELSDFSSRSTAMHELSHHYQSSYGNNLDSDDKPNLEKRMFNVLREEKLNSSSSGGYSYYGGFPEEYMGEESGTELFTCASEALFYPRAKHVNEDRHEKSDQIRQWCLGYWALLGKRGNDLLKR